MRSVEIRFRDFENTFVEVLVISVYRKIGQITVTLARVNFVAPKHVSVGRLKMQDRKMTDRKMTDKSAIHRTR